MARAGAGRLRLRAVRPGGDRPPRRVATHCDRGPHRRRPRVRAPCGARSRARGARQRAPAPRRLPPRAHARALPLGPAGRRARGLHGHTCDARCRPRNRADARAPRAPARDLAPGLRNSERPRAEGAHRAGGDARRRRWPLAAGLAAAAVLALAAAAILLRPSAQLRRSARRAELGRGRGRRRRTRSSTTSSSATIPAPLPRAAGRSGSGTSATAP